MIDDIALTEKSLIDNLLNNLPTGYAQAQVKIPNMNFTTPKNEKWLRVTLTQSLKQNVEAGGDYTRTFGIFTVDCFYPQGSGTQAQLVDVKLIQELYENQQIGNAKCFEAEPNVIGEDGAWYNTQVNINYYFEGS